MIMTDLKSLANPLFLREDELRQAIELLFYAYRDFTRGPDEILERYGFGRAPDRLGHRGYGHPASCSTDKMSVGPTGMMPVLRRSLRRCNLREITRPKRSFFRNYDKFACLRSTCKLLIERGLRV